MRTLLLDTTFEADDVADRFAFTSMVSLAETLASLERLLLPD
ncbi:hypothetical protein [Agromyces laixinhei]|nr:hypothetical protein [Agromyces laixinhei]